MKTWAVWACLMSISECYQMKVPSFSTEAACFRAVAHVEKKFGKTKDTELFCRPSCGSSAIDRIIVEPRGRQPKC